MWWKFRRHRLAVWSAGSCCSSILSRHSRNSSRPMTCTATTPPISMRRRRPCTCSTRAGSSAPSSMPDDGAGHGEPAPRLYRRPVAPAKLRFFCKGEPLQVLGHDPGRAASCLRPQDGSAYFLGTDRLGRDILSRIIHGARISLTIGILGVAMSFVPGIVIGGMAGYYGGWIDAVVQRIIEVLQSIPRSRCGWRWRRSCRSHGAASGLCRHHHHPWDAGLDRACPRRPVKNCWPCAKTTSRPRRSWRQPAPHHRTASGAGLHVASGRLGHADHSGDDPWRNRAQLSGPRGCGHR